MMTLTRTTFAAALIVGLAAFLPAQDLAPPLLLEAKDGPIDVTIGHAAPYLHDMDGDGLVDLLVGQFGEGKLRVYKNVGEAGAPRYESWTYLKAGGADATVPAG